jgi:competence protein ComEA
MEEKEKNKEKLKERIGVILLAAIFLLAGIVLIRDKEVPIKEGNTAATKEENHSTEAQAPQTKTTGVETKSEKININTASIEDLDTLPGIGEVTAQKIIDYRTQKGRFKTVDEIKEVNGIGEAKFEKIKELISI